MMSQALLDNSFNDEQENLIQNLLAVLRKRDCSKTRSVISQRFGFESGSASDIPLLMDFCIGDLGRWEQKQKRKHDIETLRRFEKVDEFKVTLEKTIQFTDDPEISNILAHFAMEVEEDPRVGFELNNKTISGLMSMHRQMSAVNKDWTEGFTKVPKKFFYDFVREVAQTYEETSGEKFTHDRIKGEHGIYLVVTPGHDFVRHSVNYLNLCAQSVGHEENYSDVHEMNACEKARKWLNACREKAV